MQYSYMLAGLIGLAVLISIGLYFFPFYKRQHAALPVLYYRATTLANGTDILPIQTIQKQLNFLLARGFTPILPQDLYKETDGWHARVKKPVILLFAGGYQSFYTQLWPLLHAKKIKCCIGIAADLIGQYNAWEQAPWQNLLTEEQIKILLKSGLVELVSHGLTAKGPEKYIPSVFISQAKESAFRLQTRFKTHVQTFAFMCPNVQPNNWESLYQTGFMLCFIPQKGNNSLPLLPQQPLKIFPVSKRTFLHSLAFKMLRP